MGELMNRCKISLLPFGNTLLEDYNNNNAFFYKKYRDSDSEVRNVRITDVFPGKFYFFELDKNETSNWIRYSPTFVISNSFFANKLSEDTKAKVEKSNMNNPGAVINMIQVVNMNFLPFEIRVALFDKFMVEDDFEKDRALPVDFAGIHNELRNYGFEYAITHYPTHRIVNAWSIDMKLVPRFLFSSSPINKYDPKALYSIWKSKINKSQQRDQEMRKLTTDDFMKPIEEIEDKFKVLTESIIRIQNRIKGK